MRAVGRCFVFASLAILLAGLSLVGVAPARAQTTNQPTISATGIGEASAPATIASVQLIVGANWDGGMSVSGAVIEIDPATELGTPEAMPVDQVIVSSGPGMAMSQPTVTADQLAPIVDAIVAAGVPEEAITIAAPAGYSTFTGPTGPNAAQIRFDLSEPTVDELKSIIETARTAATGAGLSLDHAGVRYGGVDCSTLIQQARDAAVANARENAAGLAMSLQVELGDLIQASDSPYGPFYDGSGCQPGSSVQFSGPFGDGTVAAFDPFAPVEVKAVTQVMLTFAIGSATGEA